MGFNARIQRAHVKAVADQTTRMADAMRDWPADRWQRATYCPGWSAADAVAHLTTGADFYAQVIASGRKGERQLPWGVQNAAEFRQARGAVGQTLIEAGAAALLAGFEAEAAKLQNVLETLQVSELTQWRGIRVAWCRLPHGLACV